MSEKQAMVGSNTDVRNEREGAERLDGILADST